MKRTDEEKIIYKNLRKSERRDNGEVDVRDGRRREDIREEV